MTLTRERLTHLRSRATLSSLLPLVSREEFVELLDLAWETLERRMPGDWRGPYFTCPKCGSHHFGRDIAAGVPLDTVLCHGSSSEKPYYHCDWRGIWPPMESKDEPEVPCGA